MTRAAASKSETELHIELFRKDCTEGLAHISGPGFRRKKFWVQQPVPDTIAVLANQDRHWLQMVVATGLIAAKTQRHRDKVTAMALKSGTGFA